MLKSVGVYTCLRRPMFQISAQNYLLCRHFLTVNLEPARIIYCIISGHDGFLLRPLLFVFSSVSIRHIGL